MKKIMDYLRKKFSSFYRNYLKDNYVKTEYSLSHLEPFKFGIFKDIYTVNRLSNNSITIIVKRRLRNLFYETVFISDNFGSLISMKPDKEYKEIINQIEKLYEMNLKNLMIDFLSKNTTGKNIIMNPDFKKSIKEKEECEHCNSKGKIFNGDPCPICCGLGYIEPFVYNSKDLEQKPFSWVNGELLEQLCIL